MNSDIETSNSQNQNQVGTDTQDSNVDENQTVDAPVCPDPGAILCAARELKQLNRAQVGQRLGLTETAVKNLERNQVGYFSSGVYARGYLKNYAKFMDLDVDELVEMHDQYCQLNSLETGKSHLNVSAQSSSEAGIGMKIGITVFVILVVAIGFFYVATNT